MLLSQSPQILHSSAMKLQILLLATSLPFVLAIWNRPESTTEEPLLESSLAPSSPANDLFFRIVRIANEVKNLLARDSKSYKISWDATLALGAAERIENCPEKPLRQGEFFTKLNRIESLGSELQKGFPEVSLNVFPTVTTLHNGTVRVNLQIGARIGCAFKQCSDGYDLICHFQSESTSQRLLNRQLCELDTEFPKLCIEKPVDYSLLEEHEFRRRVQTTWNEHRRTFAKRFNISRMYELKWSDFRAEAAKACGPDMCKEPLATSLFYGEPRQLEPAGTDNILRQDKAESLATNFKMLFPALKYFGCAPMDPVTCPEYSYICAIDNSWIVGEKQPLRGPVCSDCEGGCSDGLCVAPKEVVHLLKERPPGQSSADLLVFDPTERQEETTTEDVKMSSWAVVGLFVAVIACLGIVFSVVGVVVSHNYEQ